MEKTNWIDLLEWDENQLEDLRVVGFTYIKQGKYDIALHFFKTLNILEPKNAYNLQTLGAIYLQMNKNLEALNFLDKSLKIEPNHSLSLLNKSKALLSLGYKKQALVQIKNIIESGDPEVVSQAVALQMTYS
jgi:predicted Zn-dependent protease